LRVLVYSGARAGEVCQLRCEDIETIDGASRMRVRAKHPLQSVKNKPSRRDIPLHPEIAADVLAHSGNGGEWLFPSFPHDKRAGHAAQLRSMASSTRN
jgi:integrase